MNIEKRFWAKVQIRKPWQCWLWLGGSASNGYGGFDVGGSWRYVHRVCYELTWGEIPKGMYVVQGCHTRRCCNPGHLALRAAADAQRQAGTRPRKLNWDKARAIRLLWRGGGQTFSGLGRRFDVSWEMIRKITRGQAWKE